jgi:4-amino-4-deoxy-L-arabinose transferase-like glycosyltransferase
MGALHGEQSVLTTLLFGGLALAALSIRLLWATPHPLTNLTLASSAFCLFLMGLLAEDVPALRRAVIRLFSRMASFFEVSPFKAVILPFGVLLSLASWSASGDGVLTHVPEASMLWLAGILLTALALWKRPGVPGLPRPDRLYIYSWILVVCIAFGIRLYAIGDAPAAVTGDEGSVGLVASEFAAGLRNNLFPAAWQAIPSLYFGLVSLAQRLFGRSLEAIRVTSALGGALSVAGVYWAAGRLFGRTPAILSAGFMAVFNVHLLFSRIATSSVWSGVFFSVALGGLWVGAARGERSGFILAGLAAGLSHYFHPISRFILVYVLAWTLLVLPRLRRERRMAGLYAGGIAAFVTLLPLALYFSTIPSMYFAPFRAASVTGEVPLPTAISENPETTISLLSSQLRASFLGIFLVPLDGIYAPGTPLLLPLPAALFVIGLVLAIVRLRDPRMGFLLISLAGPLIVGAVSIEAPNVEFLQAITPIAAMLIGVALAEGFRWLGVLAERARARPAAPALLVVAMGLTVTLEIRHTLSMRPPFAGYAAPSAALVWQMGDFLNEFPDGTPVYLLGWPSVAFAWEPGLVYLTKGLETHDVLWPLEPGQSLPPPGTSAVLLFSEEQMGALEEVRGLYPDARVFIHMDPSTELRFASMEVGP